MKLELSAEGERQLRVAVEERGGACGTLAAASATV